MLKVIGGTYREICLEPEWNQLFGSGFRASVAASAIVKHATGSSVCCETWLANQDRHDLGIWADAFGVTLELHDRSESIEFQYEHGLSIPRIYPDPDHLTGINPVEIVGDNVLLFGLLENKAHPTAIKVTAKSLVYDPQAGAKSVPFSMLCSTTDRLAIVANMTEAEAMADALDLSVSTSEHRPIAVAKAILAAEGAEVAVVKNGAEGAFVVTSTDAHHVPSFKTEHVFKVGSGDVFSGVFAACWLEQKADPVEAAQRSSAASAYYCNRGGIHGLPIPSNYEDVIASGIEQHRIPLQPVDAPRKMVYIAGPLFNFQQRWFISEIRRCLDDHGVRTFSPYHQVGLVPKGSDVERLRSIAEADIAGLVRCSAVFAIVDGLDAGTLFEIGYAVAKGIPVIAFSQCTRREDLLMVEGSPHCRIFNDLPTAVYHAAWTALES